MTIYPMITKKRKTSLYLKIIAVFLCYFISLSTKAQDLDDYNHVELPPLEVLFENAKSSATVRYYNSRKEAEKSMLKTVKNEWLRYFKIIGAYQYGIVGSLSTITDSNQTQTLPINHLANTKQSFYNIGVGVSVPLDELFDRGNKVRRQKMEMEATEAEVERWHDEQKIRIIETYSKAKLFLNLLKIKAEAMVIAQAQYKVAESDFINGKINPADLSARKGVETDARVNYEQAKAELSMALLQLEILSQTEILNK